MSIKKRIVIDATPIFKSTHGIGRATQTFINNLKVYEYPFDITLFARKLSGPNLKSISNFIGSHTHLRLPRKSESLVKHLKMIPLLTNGDLYHATDFYLPLPKMSPAIATIHDLIYELNPESLVDHVRLSRWVPTFIKQCKRIITISEHSKKDIVKVYGVDPQIIDVIYWGIDSDFFKPPQNRNEFATQVKAKLGLKNPFYLAVSCSMGRKNTPQILKAYEKLALNNPINDLVLVWTPPEEIKTYYSNSKFGNKIHFLPFQSNESLRDLYASATAVLYPSSYEGFGLPVLEALSSGTPVVTSNVSSLPEVGGNAAIYIDPKDENSIFEVLENFENKNYDIAKLQDQGYEQASKFTWENCVTQTIQSYLKCLN